HLFFCRIMKEHSLFLMAGFPGKNREHIEKADWYREQFENLLRKVVGLSDGMVGRRILESGEVTTEYTKCAEKCTSCLTGIPIDRSITEQSERITPWISCEKMMYHNGRGCGGRQNPYRNRQKCQYRQQQCYESEEAHTDQQIREINNKAMELVGGFICFKEEILQEVKACQLFTANYPLLIEHIIREAKLYQETIGELNEKGDICLEDYWEMEQFWNRIMMEHALFIRGLLDPSEEELVRTAHEFSEDYKKLLEDARDKDLQTMDDYTRRSLVKTLQYREFKEAGTKGITECKIDSIILPLLADHVLREANHYLRILESKCRDRR
ncbi:MAG: DUF2935 domain-containing protein, partial [Dorea sp.]